MSSDRESHTNGGRCLFCSLGCRLEVEMFAPHRWRLAASRNGRRPLCARGQAITDLLNHPDRLYQPSGRTRWRRPQTSVTDMLREWLASAAPNACLEIWLDGNVAIEDLAAVHGFRESLGDRAGLLVHVPPHELGVAEGLDAAGVPQAPPEAWDDADAFLVIGNLFASHPVAASHLMRWGEARRETPMIVIDSVPGITGAYASSELTCRPGYEYWVVSELLTAAGLEDRKEWLPDSELLRRIGQDSGVDMKHVHRAAKQLRSAGRPAVILAPESGGRQRWRALTAIAAHWSARCKGTATILTGCANLLATARFMRHHGIPDWASGTSDPGRQRPGLLLVIGWDPSSMYPESCWAPLGKPAEEVIYAGAFAPAERDWVDAALPLALGCETEGSYVLADGRLAQVNPVLPAPFGIPSIRELFCESNAAGLRPGDLAAASILPEVTVPAPPVSNGHVGLPLVLTADASQYADGHMTRKTRWSQAHDLLPEVRLSLVFSKEAGIRDGEVIQVRYGRREAKARVSIADGLSLATCDGDAGGGAGAVGWGGISGASAEVRRMADWRPGLKDEAAQAGVICAEILPRVDAAEKEPVHGHA